MTNILVIDDEPSIQKLFQKMLTMEGYGVTVASNGEEAVKIFQPNTFDLVITDIIMPEKEGLETIKDLKKIDPDIKIIAISGGSNKFNSDIYLEIGLEFGAIKTLKKPIFKDELLAALKEVL